jgi:hypothetical protein
MSLQIIIIPFTEAELMSTISILNSKNLAGYDGVSNNNIEM